MKKSFLIIVLGLFTLSQASAMDIVSTDMERLPQNAQNFMNLHFPDDKVSFIRIDNEVINMDYEVVLENGNEVEFDKDGEWKKIEAKSGGVPAAIIPANIQQYINSNFPNTYVREIKKKRRSYNVELSNRLELEFDANGIFKRIDD